MFRKATSFFIFTIVCLQVNSKIIPQPYDFYDDAQNKLSALRSVVRSSIEDGDDELDAINSDFSVLADDTQQSSAAQIQEEYTRLDADLTVIKDSGRNINISSCLDGNEEAFRDLPGVISTKLNDCVSGQFVDGELILSKAATNVGAFTDLVDNYSEDLTECGRSNILCITRVVQKIELAITQVPEKIAIAVRTADGQLNPLRTAIKQCGTLNVGQFAQQGADIVSDIGVCVSLLLN